MPGRAKEPEHAQQNLFIFNELAFRLGLAQNVGWSINSEFYYYTEHFQFADYQPWRDVSNCINIENELKLSRLS